MADSSRDRYHDPNTEPSTLKFDEEAAKKWLATGAQPTETVGKLLRSLVSSKSSILTCEVQRYEKELVEVIAKALVENPDEVVVTESVKDDETVIELSVAPADMGK